VNLRNHLQNVTPCRARLAGQGALRPRVGVLDIERVQVSKSMRKMGLVRTAGGAWVPAAVTVQEGAGGELREGGESRTSGYDRASAFDTVPPRKAGNQKVFRLVDMPENAQEAKSDKRAFASGSVAGAIEVYASEGS
jgi:hypothetical protein